MGVVFSKGVLPSTCGEKNNNLMVVILAGVSWNPRVLIFSFLIAEDAEKRFSTVYLSFALLLRTVQLAHYQIYWLDFYLKIKQFFICVLGTNPFSNVWVAKAVSCLVGCLLTLVIISFCIHKLFLNSSFPLGVSMFQVLH